jgi:hypothetical protein
MRLPSQSDLFWQSHCALASSNHARMAAMQRAAGREDLAQASEATAQERQAAADAYDPRLRMGRGKGERMG